MPVLRKNKLKRVSLEHFIEWNAGVMDSCFVENPVQEMLSCGLVALLRTALDEREESVVFAATHCLASLIAPQVSVGRLSSFSQGGNLIRCFCFLTAKLIHCLLKLKIKIVAWTTVRGNVAPVSRMNSWVSVFRTRNIFHGSGVRTCKSGLCIRSRLSCL